MKSFTRSLGRLYGAGVRRARKEQSYAVARGPYTAGYQAGLKQQQNYGLKNDATGGMPQRLRFVVPDGSTASSVATSSALSSGTPN